MDTSGSITSPLVPIQVDEVFAKDIDCLNGRSRSRAGDSTHTDRPVALGIV